MAYQNCVYFVYSTVNIVIRLVTAFNAYQVIFYTAIYYAIQNVHLNIITILLIINVKPAQKNVLAAKVFLIASNVIMDSAWIKI